MNPDIRECGTIAQYSIDNTAGPFSTAANRESLVRLGRSLLALHSIFSRQSHKNDITVIIQLINFMTIVLIKKHKVKLKENVQFYEMAGIKSTAEFRFKSIESMKLSNH